MATDKKKPEWDVVVIGTGMGGSAAGAICALHGLKTLILEKNPRVGGVCSYYEKEGFHLDVGTHLFIRGNKGPFGDCTRRLGMGTPIDFIQHPLMTHFKGLGVDAVLPQSLPRLLAALPRVSVQLRVPIHRLHRIIQLFWDVMQMKDIDIRALDDISITSFLDRYFAPGRFRSILGYLMGIFFVIPIQDASAGEAVWCLRHMIRDRQLGYPRGGTVSIPKAFLKGAENHGARLQTGVAVKRIQVEDGRVRAVIVENGEPITTRAVISTTSLKETVIRLAGAEHFPAEYVDRLQNIKIAMNGVQAKIAVKKKLIAAGSIIGGLPLSVKRTDGDHIHNMYEELKKGRISLYQQIYGPIPTNYDPSLAPEGCQIITAAGIAPNLEVPNQEDASVWIDGLMNSLHQMIPGLKENIIFCDTWPVKKTAAWMGKSEGGCISTGQYVGQVANNRPDHQTAVKGLYVAGDCAGPARGVGTELACQSGMDCADLVTRHIADYVLE